MTAGAAVVGPVQISRTVSTPWSPGSSVDVAPSRDRLQEVAPHDLNGWGKPGHLGSPREGTHRHAGSQQLIENRSPHSTGGAGHQDGVVGHPVILASGARR